MKSVAVAPPVASKAPDSPVVEAHGARIPQIGLGTWNLRGSTCVRMVEQALRLGYRHVDTAEMYDNEREVGEACVPPGWRGARCSSPRRYGRRISPRANSSVRSRTA